MAQKKTAAKKAAAKKAPAKKAPAKKAPAKKAPAKKARAKKAAASEEERQYGPRADLNSPIDGLLEKLPGHTRAIVEAVRALVHAAVPGVEEAIKWGMPVFSKDGILCYLRPSPAYVRFGFHAARERMPDPEGLLQGEGEGGHVKLRSLEDIRPPLFTEWVRIAAGANS